MNLVIQIQELQTPTWKQIPLRFVMEMQTFFFRSGVDTISQGRLPQNNIYLMDT